jgi:thiosulfate reductase/polysulfide reductase chain A
LFDFAPENRLWLHPASAQSAGVADGDLVEVASRVGSAQLRATVTQEIRPDCVFMLHGFGKRSPWLKRAYNRGGSDSAILETAWDKVSGNAAMHETFVTVRKV